MKINKLTGFLSLIIAALFILSACEESTTPSDPVKPKPVAPTGLMATSKDSSSVILKWTPSTSETDTNWANYVLEVTSSTGGPIAPKEIDKADNPYTFVGLNEGTVYTFKLYSKFKNDNESETAAQVTWSPASRFVFNENVDMIKVYETNSDYASGLDLYNPETKKPRGLKVANGADWDLGLYTTQGVMFGSASELPYDYTGTPLATDIGGWLDAASLDVLFDSEALNATKYQYSPTVYNLEEINVTYGLAFFIRKMEPGNDKFTYAKVLVKKQMGTFLQGTAPNRYVICEISYQKVAGVPYAKKPVH